MVCFVKALKETTIATRVMNRMLTTITDGALLEWSVVLAAPKASCPRES
jgi:hypothetical protein